MPEFTQLPLPGMPLRIVVSAVWESGDRRATIRATVDAPSDEYSSMVRGFDTEGKFTPEELLDAMAMLLYALRPELV